MNNGKVLVMDDHKDIRYIFTILLKRIHYEVEVAADGHEAIELFKFAIGIKKPFDAVIMDLKVADGMGGEEATKMLLEIDNRAKIILSSGSVTDPMMINYWKYGVTAVLHKPFNNDDINEVLRKVISG